MATWLEHKAAMTNPNFKIELRRVTLGDSVVFYVLFEGESWIDGARQQFEFEANDEVSALRLYGALERAIKANTKHTVLAL